MKVLVAADALWVREQVRAASALAEGVVVGSALVACLARAVSGGEDPVARAVELVRVLSGADLPR